FELYARTTPQGACSVRRVADDTVVARLPELGEPATAAFGPGRPLVVYGETSGRCQLWDLSGPGRSLRLDQRQGVDRSGGFFRPDGRLLLRGYQDGSIQAFATDTGVCQHRLAPNGITRGVYSCPHPTGPFVATSSYWSNLLQVRDLRTGDVLVAHKLPWPGSSLCA